MDIRVIDLWVAGSGSGWGSGSGEGSGSGSGWGSIIKTHNGNKVYYIDGIPTVILSIHRAYAKGYMIGVDYQRSLDCFIAKSNGVFAHGTTLRDAANALQAKLIERLPISERISAFCARFDKTTAYPASEFFEWHHFLTGSCLMGRQQFCSDHGITMTDTFTVKEFISITERAFGGDIVQQLKKYYN